MPDISSDLLKRIRRVQVYTTHLAQDLFFGAYRSAFKGKGIEFEEVREYQPGDEVRSIDWNVTARMNNPFIKVFREERELTINLIVDISASSHFGISGFKKKDIMAEIGAVLAFSAQANNDKVGLLLFSDAIELYLEPKKGLRHNLRVVRELLYHPARSKGTDIGAALAFLGNMQARSGICFLISDFIGELNFAHEIKILSKKHDIICVAVNDPYEQKFPPLGLLTTLNTESGRRDTIDAGAACVEKYDKAIQEKRVRLRNLLNSVGAGLIEISTEKPFIPALKKFFRMRMLKNI